ncbi:MAG: hypothetical protein OXI01_16165 [Albidovulum sp.]|nr:hypothetical protein [Albidovulum sp.]
MQTLESGAGRLKGPVAISLPATPFRRQPMDRQAKEIALENESKDADRHCRRRGGGPDLLDGGRYAKTAAEIAAAVDAGGGDDRRGRRRDDS